jgi:NTP pyrophosphatase (non-canonical NTP hydrolase)
MPEPVEIYVVMRKSRVIKNQFTPVMAYFVKAAAVERFRALEQQGERAYIMPVPILSLATVVHDYYQYRDYVDPDALEAFLWLVSEVGEAAEALAETYFGDKEWVRNHPDERKKDPATEGADILMMLTKFMHGLHADPIAEMITKFKSKGWTND